MFTAADVNLNRILSEINQLSEIGKTPDGGIRRPTFGEAHVQAMHLVASWMASAGLEPSFDQWGNLYGRTSGKVQDRSVMSGSHLDSVPNGGNYDGPLGVLSALEAMRLILEKNITIKKPLEVVSFIEEEGSRFHGLLGSTLATNRLADNKIAEIADFDGNLFLDVLDTMEFKYPVYQRAVSQQVDAFVELHIEQGKRLEKAGIPIGLVTSIAGPRFWQIALTGQADHAGATEYEDRRDAMLAGAELIMGIREIGLSTFAETARMTVGKVNVKPNVTNIVAGTVVLDVDTRTANEDARREVEQALTTITQQISAKHKVGFQIESKMDVHPAICPDIIRTAIQKGAGQAGVEFRPIVSWAAHDTMQMSHVCPAGMIFVPCRDGRSHCPEEFVTPEDIAVGVAVLANTLLELAG